MSWISSIQTDAMSCELASHYNCREAWKPLKAHHTWPLRVERKRCERTNTKPNAAGNTEFTLEKVVIDLYSWATPNGHKVHLMLEECALPYAVHAVDIGVGDQFKPEFLAMSPNNRIPAIVDHNGPDGKPISLMESGAILLYLAGKSGRFMPRTVKGKYECLQWLMWQMGGLGPMLGQAHHFRNYAPEKIEYAINRYTDETKRLYGVMNKQLGKTQAFMTGKDYTIADIACWPWIRSHANHGISLDDFSNIKRWYETIEARPAAKRAVLILADRRKPLLDDKAKAVLFGAQQYQRR